MRSWFEPRFGADLGGVRVHLGAGAAQAADGLAANAYTIGSDIVFGAGRYAPETAAGQRLLAHELAHVVHHGPASATIHRDANQGRQGGQPSADAAMTARLEFARSVLSAAPELAGADRTTLGRIVDAVPVYEAIRQRQAVREQRRSEVESIEYHERTNEMYAASGYSTDPLDAGVPPPAGVPASPEMFETFRQNVATADASIEQLDYDIAASIAEFGLSDEATVIWLVDVEFPAIWARRAKVLADTRLEVSREQVLEQQRRYPADACTVDQGALRAADAELARLDGERAQARDEQPRLRDEREAQLAQRRDMDSRRRGAEEPGGLPGGVPPSNEEWAAIDASIEQLDRRIEANESAIVDRDRAFLTAYATHGRAHPALYMGGYQPGMFASMDDGQLAARVGSWTQKLLDNIARTRANIADDTIKVWDLNDIPDQTYDSLGVPRRSVLGQSVDRFVANKRSQRAWLDIAIAVLEIAVVIGVSIVATPLAGAAVGLAFSAVHLGFDLAQVVREEAAANTNVHPELRDLSANDPDYLAVILDIAGMVPDIVVVARALRPAAAALRAGGEAADFALAAEREVGRDAARRLTETAVRRWRLGSAAERIGRAQAWVRRVLAAPASVIRDLTDLAIERLRRLPGWMLERLRMMNEAGMRAALGCASPCKVDLEEIRRFLTQMTERGAPRGATLANTADIVAALPADVINVQLITAKLSKHPSLRAAINASGMTAEDFGALRRFTTAADLANPETAYETFTRYLSMVAANRAGSDVNELNRIAAAMSAAQSRGPAASLKGSMFEAWARLHVSDFANTSGFERLTTNVGGRPLIADRWIPSRGEVWDFKHYTSTRSGDLVRTDQAGRYVQLIGQQVDGHTVSSINYVFPSLEVALANRRRLVSRGLEAIQVHYVGANNALVLVP